MSLYLHHWHRRIHRLHPWRELSWRAASRYGGVDNFSTGKKENLAEIFQQIDFHQADLLDLDAMHKAAPESTSSCTRLRSPPCQNPCSIRWPTTAPNVDGTVTYW